MSEKGPVMAHPQFPVTLRLMHCPAGLPFERREPQRLEVG